MRSESTSEPMCEQARYRWPASVTARTSRSRSSTRTTARRSGWVPKCTAADVDRAVRARGRRAAPRAAAAVAARRDPRPRRDACSRNGARTSPAPSRVEAAKPIKTARVEATRAVSTFQFSAAVARTLTGEMVPLDASDVGEGKLGFVLRVPVGVVGAISPFNFPLEPRRAQAGAGDRGGLSRRAQAGEPDAVLRHRARRPAARRVRPAAGLAQRRDRQRRRRRQRARRSSRCRARSRFTGSPPVGWGIRERAPRKRVGLELGNNAPVIIEPSGDWKTAAVEDQGRRLQPRRPVVHLDATGVRAPVDPRRLRRRARATRSRRSSSAIRSTKRPTCPSLISPGRHRAGERRGSTKRSASGAHVEVGGEVHGRLLEPTVLTGVASRHEGVHRGGVRSGRRRRRVRRRRRGAAARERHALRTAGRDLHQRARRRAARGADARLRWRARQRGADVADRSDAVRRRARQRQHSRGPGVRGARDDRGAPDRDPERDGDRPGQSTALVDRRRGERRAAARRRRRRARQAGRRGVCRSAAETSPVRRAATGTRRRATRRRVFHAAVAELEAEGIVLRDVRQGLVDFPARAASGRGYWLCWLVGEPEVAWWHWPEDGFAGRTPLSTPPA